MITEYYKITVWTEEFGRGTFKLAYDYNRNEAPTYHYDMDGMEHSVKCDLQDDIIDYFTDRKHYKSLTCTLRDGLAEVFIEKITPPTGGLFVALNEAYAQEIKDMNIPAWRINGNEWPTHRYQIVLMDKGRGLGTFKLCYNELNQEVSTYDVSMRKYDREKFDNLLKGMTQYLRHVRYFHDTQEYHQEGHDCKINIKRIREKL